MHAQRLHAQLGECNESHRVTVSERRWRVWAGSLPDWLSAHQQTKDSMHHGLTENVLRTGRVAAGSRAAGVGFVHDSADLDCSGIAGRSARGLQPFPVRIR
eukprot:7389162-Prymnesium_polylepis.2